MNNKTQAANRMNNYKAPEAEPTFHVVPRNVVPVATHPGREAIITSLSFWQPLMDRLKKGLSRLEAVDVELRQITDASGETIDAPQLITRIRYQFNKLGLLDKYSLIAGTNGDGNHLYVVDHESASLLAATA